MELSFSLQRRALPLFLILPCSVSVLQSCINSKTLQDETRAHTPFTLTLFWCPGCSHCVRNRNPKTSSRHVCFTFPSQLLNCMQKLALLLRRPGPFNRWCWIRRRSIGKVRICSYLSA